ncbi:MAG: hypothetical protein ACYCZO_07785 [Daejeonella sp.]
MEKLITHHKSALRFLMTEDIYILREEIITASLRPIPEEIYPEIQKEEIQNSDFNYIGENNRYFLILIDDKTHAELNSSHKEMLLKIMAAKGLDIRDLAIVNLAKYPEASFSLLKDFFSCNKIVLFGIDPQRISLPAIAANKVIKHMEVMVLASFSLEEMSSSTDKKREFWSVMKNF